LADIRHNPSRLISPTMMCLDSGKLARSGRYGRIAKNGHSRYATAVLLCARMTSGASVTNSAAYFRASALLQ
jgi:hypothetical protein